MNATPWEQVRDESLGSMSDAERAEYDRALVEARIALDLAQMVYDARQAAGLTQTELARRAGTTQGAISAIESASKVPTVITLRRIATALDTTLEVRFANAPRDPRLASA